MSDRDERPASGAAGPETLIMGLRQYHTNGCDSRFDSICGDSQRCSCGLDARLAQLTELLTGGTDAPPPAPPLTCFRCHKPAGNEHNGPLVSNDDETAAICGPCAAEVARFVKADAPPPGEPHESEVMPNESNAMHLSRTDRRNQPLPGASVEAGAQHPDKNTAVLPALRALVEQWRTRAKDFDRFSGYGLGALTIFLVCADQLEALLGSKEQ
jgi:hypothetical protein